MLDATYRRLLLQSLYEKERKYFFSFHGFQDYTNLTEIYPMPEEAERAVEAMSNMAEIIAYLDDIKYIESVFNIEYRKFFAIVSRLLKSTDDECLKTGCKLSILDDKSPMYQFKNDRVQNPDT